jgi:uncharacterized oligopeptide transporter (OPT) family protein
MGLFQRPAVTPEEIAASKPLAILPAEVAEMDEEEWYARAYRGDATPQLTIRAVLMGTVLGFLLAFTNLYSGLKTGWHLGVAITACILSFAIWRLFLSLRLVRSPMSILENNCMQSTASAAGYSTGSTMVSAIPAMLMLSVSAANPGGQHLPWPVLAAWTFLVAMLGCFLAIPMKRTMINRERLRFPSGTAAAVTLQSLYADGAAALRKAKALLWSSLAGAVITPLIQLNAIVKIENGETVRGPLIASDTKIFNWLPARGINPATGQNYLSSDWGLQIDKDPLLFGAGMIIGIRVTFWMLVGALILAYGAGPWGLTEGWTNAQGTMVYAVSKPKIAWKELGLWFGAPFLVASALTSLAFQWRSFVNAFRGFGGGAGRRSDVEVPNSWFFIGAGLAAVGLILLAASQFDVPIQLGALAVLMTFVLCIVASRVTGETDTTPTGAMGKITQMTYGVLLKQNPQANLMTAGITSGSASACADLLNDLKSGYLLGAGPRRQFFAQFLGVFTGTAATVIGFHLLVPDASKLPSAGVEDPAFIAPAAAQWKAVADLFTLGIANFHPAFRAAIFLGLALGFVFAAVERLAPKPWRRFLPSAAGIGLGFIVPAYQSVSFFLGGLAVWIWERRGARSAQEYAIAVASGLIAGASLIGVIVALLNNFVFN